MANAKEPQDKTGKSLKLLKKDVKYLRVNFDTGLKYAKKGTIWMYWIEPIEWYRLSTGDEIETKYKNKYYDISNELQKVILEHKCEFSKKNDFVFKDAAKAKKRQLLKDRDLQIEAELENSPQPSAEAAPKMVYSNIGILNKPAPVHISSSIQTPKPQTNTGSVAGTPGTPFPEHMQPFISWHNFTDIEMRKLYSSYVKWMNLPDNKANDLYKSATKDGKVHDQLDEFVMFGLVKKTVADDAIPPLSLLKKIPEIVTNPELMNYYERKVNKKGPEVGSKKFLLKKGQEIAINAMPTSMKVAFTASKLALGGIKLASSGIGSLLGGMLSKKNEDVSRDTTNQPELASPVMGSEKDLNIAKDPLNSSNLPISPVGKDYTPDNDSGKSMKVIGAGLNGIMKILSDRLPTIKKTETDTTVKSAENRIGVTSDIASVELEKLEKSKMVGEGKDGDKKDEKGSMFGKVISGMLAAFLFFAGKIKALGTMFGVLGTSLASLLGRLGTWITGGIKSIGKVVAGGAGSLAKAATMLIPTLVATAADGILGKMGVGKDEEGNDLVNDEESDDTNWDKMNATEKFQSGIARGIEKTGKFLFLGNMSAEAKSQRIKSESEYLAKREVEKAAAASSVQNVSRDISSKVESITNKNDEMNLNSSRASTQSIVDAANKSITIQQMGSSGGSRMYPRSNSGTFQRFFDNRARFA